MKQEKHHLKNYGKIKSFFPACLCILLCLFLFGCSNENRDSGISMGNGLPKKSTEESGSENAMRQDVEYAVVIEKNPEEQEISLQQIRSKERYTLTYTGGTTVLSKHEKQLSMSEISVGEIVEVKYSNSTKKLEQIQISTAAWENTDVKNLVVDRGRNMMSVGTDNYSYSSDLVVVSDNRLITLLEVSDVDELTLRGIGKEIYSIEVVKGHGYIRLQRANHFVGGIIEIGSKIMLPIQKEMLIVAPEGQCRVTATVNGKGGSSTVQIDRDEEIVIDATDFQEYATRKGSVIYTVNPDTAVMKIDGKETDFSKSISLPYGTYEIELTAEGYKTYTENLMINSISKKRKVDMVALEEETKKDEKESTKEAETVYRETETETSDEYQVYIDAPENVKVYFDGVYKGVAPTHFYKTSGTHTIVLSLTGYNNIAYTVNITNDDSDVHYTFPDLTESAG